MFTYVIDPTERLDLSDDDDDDNDDDPPKVGRTITQKYIHTHTLIRQSEWVCCTTHMALICFTTRRCQCVCVCVCMFLRTHKMCVIRVRLPLSAKVIWLNYFADKMITVFSTTPDNSPEKKTCTNTPETSIRPTPSFRQQCIFNFLRLRLRTYVHVCEVTRKTKPFIVINRRAEHCCV